MLRLIAPGKRKNRYWSVRGTLDGHKIEKSLDVSLRSDAEKKFKSLIVEYQKSRLISENVTFKTASDRYIAFRDPDMRTIQFLEKICSIIGHKLVTEISLDDLVHCANRLYPTTMSSSKNRAVMVPVAAVMHYSARNKWCEWLRIEKFKEAAPKTRFVEAAVETKLIGATTGKQRLLIMWLFQQGDRISDAIKIKYEDCDLDSRTVSRHISKSDRHLILPLSDDICKMLKAFNQTGEKSGFIFPWKERWNVYRWLRPLCRKLGVQFTPHRARHTLGKRMNDGGAGLKTIMQVLGQSDPQSAIRYQTTDVETLRQAKKKAGTR